MEEKEKMEEIRAHNGSTIKVNISNKACEKYSGFKHGDFIVKDKKIAMAIGVGYNPFSLQTEFWKMEPGDLGVTSTDPKKWRKAEIEEVIEMFKNGKRSEITIVEYLDSKNAQVA